MLCVFLCVFVRVCVCACDGLVRARRSTAVRVCVRVCVCLSLITLPCDGVSAKGCATSRWPWPTADRATAAADTPRMEPSAGYGGQAHWAAPLPAPPSSDGFRLRCLAASPHARCRGTATGCPLQQQLHRTPFRCCWWWWWWVLAGLASASLGTRLARSRLALGLQPTPFRLAGVCPMCICDHGRSLHYLASPGRYATRLSLRLLRPG